MESNLWSPTINTSHEIKQKLIDLKLRFAKKEQKNPLEISDSSVKRIMANETAGYEDNVVEVVRQQLE